MTRRRSHWLVLLACAITAVGTAGVATAVTQAATVHTCVSKSSGLVRVAKKCKTSEKVLVLGQTGPQGPAGAAGAPGPKGDTGPAGPLLTSLPAGTTVYGTAGLYFTSSTGSAASVISLPYPFVTEPTVVLVAPSGTDLHCTGSVDHPSAPSGYICFYEGINNTSFLYAYGYDGYPSHSTKRGVALIGLGTAGGNGYVFGTWAATG